MVSCVVTVQLICAFVFAYEKIGYLMIWLISYLSRSTDSHEGRAIPFGGAMGRNTAQPQGLELGINVGP